MLIKTGIYFLLFCVIALSVILCVFWSRYQRRITRLNNEITEKTSQIELANQDREWLIKEIHHRVKNNLQIIMSLLNTQSFYLTNDEAVKAVRNSQNRLYAISLAHQKLYLSDSLSSIDMVLYVQELIAYLQDAFSEIPPIIFQFDLVPLSLDVNTAVPIGIIINEAVSNTLKYAFPAGSEGIVKITLSTEDQIKYCFSIADNGVGLNDDYEQKVVDSFGMNLITGLTQQIGGCYTIKNNKGIDNKGVEILITFNAQADSVVNETELQNN